MPNARKMLYYTRNELCNDFFEVINIRSAYWLERSRKEEMITPHVVYVFMVTTDWLNFT